LAVERTNSLMNKNKIALKFLIYLYKVCK